MLIEYILPYTPKDQEVHNSVAYFTKGSSPYDLLVINGLEENDPYIANDISDFATNEYLDLQEGFLVSFGLDQFEPGQVFQLSDPIYPDLYFVPQFGCRIYIRDNLLFSQYRHIISVYEHNSTNLEPLVIFNGLHSDYGSEESLKLLQIELALVAQDFNGKKFEFPIDWQMYTDRDPERAQVEKDLLDGKTTIEEVNWAWTDGP